MVKPISVKVDKNKNFDYVDDFINFLDTLEFNCGIAEESLLGTTVCLISYLEKCMKKLPLTYQQKIYETYFRITKGIDRYFSQDTKDLILEFCYIFILK